MAHKSSAKKESPGCPWRVGMCAEPVSTTHLPDWYWRRGLHDARLLAIHSDLSQDGHMCVTLTLDSHNACFDTEITGVRLSLASAKLALPDMRHWRSAYWLSDTLQPMDAYPHPLYRLEIRLCVYGVERIEYVLPFTIIGAEILRAPCDDANGGTMLWSQTDKRRTKRIYT